MPEAPVHKYDSAMLLENKVRLARKLPVQTKSQARFMQKAANHQFRLRVLATYAGHHPAAGFLVDDIGHDSSGEQ